jgi:Tfp pilus assembly protein PilV
VDKAGKQGRVNGGCGRARLRGKSQYCENITIFSFDSKTLSGMRKQAYEMLLFINTIMTPPRQNRHHQMGTTLPEVLIAVLLFAGFCGSIFELNAVCLRYIDASKESIGALESIHDRCETLRNLAFTDLTNLSYVQNLLAAPANSSEFCHKASETVKLYAYPTAHGVTQFTRKPDGTVTTDSTASDLGNTLVELDISTTWKSTLGEQARLEQISTIISNGTKK